MTLGVETGKRNKVNFWGNANILIGVCTIQVYTFVKTWILYFMNKCYIRWGLEHFTVGKFSLKKEVNHYWSLVNDIHDDMHRHEVCNESKFKTD